MRIITAPVVTIVSKPQFIPHPNYKIPPGGDESQRIGAFASKGCYNSYGEGGRPNYENQLSILEHRHGSVLEHINYGLFIEGITRGLSIELNRHRTLAISQRSTRYVDESDAAIVLSPYFTSLYKKCPVGMRNNIKLSPPQTEFDELAIPDKNDMIQLFAYIDVQRQHLNQYSQLVSELVDCNPYKLTGTALQKWARGIAKDLLPAALETKATYTNNIRGWRWIIESRSDEHAEDEIRRLVVEIHSVLFNEAPLYFGDFYQSKIVRNIPVLVPAYSKV